MRSIKSLVFFDVDGTLMNSRFELETDVLEAIHRMKDNGHIPILATGRPFHQIEDILEQTEIKSYILSNGQFISYEGEIIGNHVIEPEVIDDLMTFLKENGMSMAFFNNHYFVTTVDNHLYKNTLELFNLPEAKLQTDFYLENDVLMILLFSDDMKKDKVLTDNFPMLNFVRTSPYSLDVFNESSSKAIGIQKMKDFIGQPDIPTFAFGDSMNDFDMIKAVDYGIAMGNAVDELKNVADLVVSSNDDGGIVEGLKYYHLI